MTKKRDLYMIDGKQARSVSEIKAMVPKPWLAAWAAKMASEFLGGNEDERIKKDAMYKGMWLPDRAYSKEEIFYLLHEAKRHHNSKKTSAGDFGQDKHGLLADCISGQLEPAGVENEDDRKILENFQIVTKGWEWIATEIPLSNRKLGYGGTADGLARDEHGTLILPDFKTSNFVGADVSIQLALYALAEPNAAHLRDLWAEMREIGEGRVIHLNKERKTWEVLERPLKPHYPYMPSFCHTHEWMKKFDQR